MLKHATNHTQDRCGALKKTFRMKIKILICTFFLVFNYSCVGQNNKVDKIGEEGVQLFSDGRIEEALLRFEKVIELDNQNSEAFMRKGDCLDLLGDLNGSIESYSNAIKLNPDNKIVIYNRALTYEKLNDLNNAIADYIAAIGSDPQNKSELNNKLIYHNLGILYGQKEELNNAIDAFTQAIGIDKEYADAYHNRGFAHYLKKEYKKAIENYDMALKIEPNNMFYKASKNVSKAMLE